jgi:CRP/FNR family transcriptional regulator, cyclic AMP receptor protein
MRENACRNPPGTAEILAARLRQVDEALAATTFLTVKARVARALLELAEYIGQPSSAGHTVFNERISQADLAAMAGVARENVSRVLSGCGGESS